MAQLMVSWSVSGGMFRIHAVKAVGRKKARIIEVEVVDTGERLHGSPRKMERMVRRLSKVDRLVRHLAYV